MSVYIGEAGLPKPRAVRDPAAALMPEFLSLIGAEVDDVVHDRPALDWGRTVITAHLDPATGEIVTHEIDIDELPLLLARRRWWSRLASWRPRWR